MPDTLAKAMVPTRAATPATKMVLLRVSSLLLAYNDKKMVFF
jgi:hypothetical protein